MSISVDINGNVTGTIELEDGDLLAGKHVIEIEGSSGTIANGLYINDPSASTDDLRQVFISGSTDDFAPVAQTFKVKEERDLLAVELDLDASAGTEDVVIQIREVENGFPSASKILAESRVEQANVQAAGTFTRFDLSPVVSLLVDREYCITVHTSNIEYTIAIAQLGGIDVDTGDAIAKQPNAGVLLTSSNGSTWTAEQGKDLKFKLIAATYAVTEKTVDLGVFNATDITDFMIASRTEINDKDSQVEYTITDPDGTEYIVDKDQVTSMASKKTGNFAVSVTLKGSDKKSPILFPNTELVCGELQATGEYHSVAFKVPDTFDFTVIIDSKLSGSANYTPAIESASSGNYIDLAPDSSETLPDGYVRTYWKGTGFAEVGTSNLSSIRITANCPTVSSRVFLRKLIGYSE